MEENEFYSGKCLFKTVSKIISRTHNNTKPSERFYHCILSSIEAASPQVRPHLLWQSSKVEVTPDSDDSERNWLFFFKFSSSFASKKNPTFVSFFFTHSIGRIAELIPRVFVEAVVLCHIVICVKVHLEPECWAHRDFKEASM